MVWTDEFTDNGSPNSSKWTYDIGNNGWGNNEVQLYLQDPFASAVRPIRELKGFELVSLKPGETKKVIFTIDKKMLQFYSVNKTWESETGDFNIFIGADSTTKRKATFVLN